MRLTVAIPPYAEPVTVTEMKVHLKIESAVTDDDALIATQIVAARETIEAMTGANSCRCQTMMATTFDLTLSEFPPTYIEVPRVPLISVTSITYVDTSGNTQTLASTVYSVNTAEGRIYLAYGQVWPSLRSAFEDRITVKFIAGMAATFTAVAATDVLTFNGRSYAVGDRVRVLNSGGALPAGMSAATDYFVIASSKVSLTSGGSTIDITDTGTGTHYVGLSLHGFDTLKAAIKLLAGHFYYNREAVVVGTITSSVPMAVENLVMSQHA